MLSNKICSVDGCNKKHFGRSFCSVHYSRWKRNGDPEMIKTVYRTLKERFYDGFEPVTESGCWLWLKCCNPAGYGLLGRKHKSPLAHRVSWELHVGEIPDGLIVCHSCDVPCCVNPSHLFVGTFKDNTADMMKKGRDVRPIGKDSPNSKLTDSKVREIRKMSKTLNQTKIASEFNVTPSVINRILRGKPWKHVI